MKTFQGNSLKLALALLMAALFIASGFAPAGHASAACSPTPGAIFDLYASTGTTNLYTGTTVSIWGYSLTSGGAPSLPGPVLTVNQGDCVQVTLHNNLAEPTALLFQGQSMVPDTSGAIAGGTQVYSFNAANAGTFLYEAGLMPGTQHQVALGMYGAFIVKSATAGTAYGSSASSFDQDVVVVLSEYDPNVAAVNPATFEMRNYAPRYFLINGKAFYDSITSPFSGDISVTSGNKVLLRYVNAGLQAHAMSTLGLSQKVLAQDGSAYAHPHSMVAETIAPGQTLDSLVTIPASTSIGTKFPLYDANLMLRNSNASGFGGMLTFLTSGSNSIGGPGPDTTGPSVSGLSLTPNLTNGSVAVAISATISDVAAGNNNVTAAEYYIDSTSGTPIALSGTFATPSVTVNGTISVATLATLTSGTHTIYVRGQDLAGNWGPFLGAQLNLDKTGPATSGLTLTPNPSSGSVTVALTATGDDTTTGNSNVTAAEYWVDGGAHTAMTASGSAAPVRNFTATIPAGLSMGTHVVSVRSQDALGNWGSAATINLQVKDTVAPTTSNVVASPNPNNGSQPFSTSVQAVRVTASFSDTATGNSNIAAAEGFIDSTGTTGTGFSFIASDGAFSSPAENGYSDIPLAVVGTLSNGNHTIYVHAKDSAGNWGSFATTVLVINKTLYFSTLGNSNPPGVGGTADDADIYFWNGSAFSRVLDASVTPYSFPNAANVDGFDRLDATHFYMSFSSDVTIPGLGTVQDEDIVAYNSGVWSVYFDGTARGLTANNQDIDAFNISGDTLYFSTLGGNPPTVGGTADAGDIYSWNGSAFSRVIDISAAPYSLAAGSDVDGFVRTDATHFYMSFSSDTAVPGLGTMQDEDVVYYNGGTWQLYFDGTAKGLTANNQDIDAFDIP